MITTPDTRNVIDRYKQWEDEQIIADLETRRTPFVHVCVNLTGDFNKSSVIRANNAFTGRKVIITERRRFDRRGCVGTHNYEHVEYNPDTFDAINTLITEGYTVYPVDNTPEFHPESIYKTQFAEKSAFLYGEEGAGLSSDVVAVCNAHPVYIPQYGSVRSINVAQSAAVIMSILEIQYPRDELFA